MASRNKPPKPAPRDFGWALDKADPRPDLLTGTTGQKVAYSGRLSDALAIVIADALREKLPDIRPDSDGKGRESRARTSKGFKKLDVNYSTLETGLGLGVSIKTINFPDLVKDKKTGERKVGRYTKNYTARDNELRAEAQDYHLRQPYAVMVGVVCIPADACKRQEEKKLREGAWSSFAQAIRIFRHRAGREGPKDVEELFERLFVGVYEHEGDKRGEVWFFDVMENPRRFGRPRRVLDFKELIEEILREYDKRNYPPFEWDPNGENGSAHE